MEGKENGDDEQEEKDGGDEEDGEDEKGGDHLEKVELLPHDGIHLLSDLILHLQSLLTPERYHRFGHQSPLSPVL